MRRLEDIGFYTLSEARCRTASPFSPMTRAELVLSGRCNFACPYCRHVGGRDMSLPNAMRVLHAWIADQLFAVRFSGGEPTLYPHLPSLVKIAAGGNVKKIALSTNGSAPTDSYRHLIDLGVNDLSISLDACCAEDGDHMAGGIKGAWELVVENIRVLSRLVYLTVGIVLTTENAPQASAIIQFAADLGVSDIRIIPAAQAGARLPVLELSHELLARFPILRYRIEQSLLGYPLRGLRDGDARRCGLVLDDTTVCGTRHYPCIIYLRERGKPIGQVSDTMRQERETWFRTHETFTDPLCSTQCLDVCRFYNRQFEHYHAYPTPERRPSCAVSSVTS